MNLRHVHVRKSSMSEMGLGSITCLPKRVVNARVCDPRRRSVNMFPVLLLLPSCLPVHG
jgi:hypothetical protein